NTAGYRGSGLFANSSAGSLTVNIYNSIIIGNNGARDVQTGGSRATVRAYNTLSTSSYSQWWDEGSNNLIYSTSRVPTVFVGETENGYDYNLAEGSPAIDAGNTNYAVLYGYDADGEWGPTANPIESDFVRYARVNGDRIDLGALEYGSQPYYEAILRPENVRFSDYDANAGTVVVSWDDMSYNELGFRVEISTDGENWSWVAQTAENVASTTLTGIEPNTPYYVRVRAEVELSNVSEWSEVADFTSLVYALDEPSVAANAAGSTEIALAIGEVENAVGYVYEYSANPDFSDATRGELATAGTLAIAGLNPNTTYYFRAYAVGSGAYLNSPWASTYATTEKAVLPAPTPSVALTEEETTLELSFETVENATSYVYRYSTSADFADATEVAAAESGAFEISGLEPGETYYFQTKAVGGGDYVDSEWSTAISATTEAIDLPAPSVAIEAVGTTTLDFTVGAVANATAYYYRYAASEAELANATPIALDAAGTVALSGLPANATRYFQAAAVGDGVGYLDSAWSAPVSATTLKIVLDAPSVVATATGSSTANVEIGYVANASSYVYEYSTSPDFANATTGETALRSVDVAGLSAYATYYFRVKAVGTGAYESSDWSETVSATTAKVALEAPEINAVATSSSEIALTIGAVDFATGYYCEYSTDATFANAKSLMAGAETITFSDLTPGTTYYFRVLAYGGSNATASDWATDSATTEQAVLSAPTPTLAKSGSSARQLKLSFDAVDNATSYVYRYSKSADFANATEVTTEEAGEFTVRNLNSGTTYYFQAKAIGDGTSYLDSEWSPAISATTSSIPLTPPSVSVEAVGSTTLTFKIAEVLNATTYYYRYAASEAELADATWQSGAAGTVELTGLNPNATYCFQARVTGGYGYTESQPSAPVFATTLKIALDAPSVAATATGSATATFEIGAVENADGYVYEISTSRYFTDDAIVSTGTAASAGAFDVDGLSPRTTYYFRAKAIVDSAVYESSTWSATVSATTEKIALSAPEVSAVATSPTTLALTISKVPNASEYVYLMSTNADFSGAQEVATGSGTIFLTGLTPGQTYYFKAMAKAAANGVYADSEWSEETSAKMRVALDAPTVAAVATGASTIDLTIAPVENATEYVYRYATSEDGLADAEWSAPVSAGTVALTGLEPYTTYYVQAYAVGDGAGYVDSEWSETDSATTERGQLPVPTIEVVSLSDDAFEFNFEKDENATSYVYQVSTSPVADPNAWETATDSTIALDGLTPNTVYYIFVQGIGNEAYADSPVADSVARTWEEASTIVTIADDVLDHYDGEISLREA
ncbi:MAG: fibronectin type III domain-containing protein, partial [Thermoguttaceae bacterium]|nr:fibronectin type III domain-containing protein [Thermoguttaceae bacterium]